MDLYELSEKVLAREELIGFDLLSVQEQNFIAIWELEAGVNSGGFAHYFLEPAADHAFHVPPALMEIGAHQAAEIVALALGVFSPLGPPRDGDERRSALESLVERDTMRLEELAADFLAYPDPLLGLLESYVDRRAKSFAAQARPISPSSHRPEAR